MSASGTDADRNLIFFNLCYIRGDITIKKGSGHYVSCNII